MVCRAAGSDDVDPGLREGAREVLEQAGAVVGVDLQLDPIGGLVLAVPADVDEPFRRPLQRLHVLAIAAVDGDAAAEGYVTRYIVTGNGAAALGQSHGDVGGPLDADPVVGGVLGPPRLVLAVAAGEPERVGVLNGVPSLQPLHQLVGDSLGRDFALA